MKTKSALWLIAGIILTAAMLFGLASFISHSTHSTLSNREVALICTTDMATQFHIHPNLKIVINESVQEIPANIGVNATCMNPLHTHDASGILHIESPEKRDFSLGDFFAVWGQPFSKDQILDYKIDAEHQILVTVNGASVDSYENTILRDHDQIVITYENK